MADQPFGVCTTRVRFFRGTDSLLSAPFTDRVFGLVDDDGNLGRGIPLLRRLFADERLQDRFDPREPFNDFGIILVHFNSPKPGF